MFINVNDDMTARLKGTRSLARVMEWNKIDLKYDEAVRQYF